MNLPNQTVNTSVIHNGGEFEEEKQFEDEEEKEQTNNLIMIMDAK